MRRTRKRPWYKNPAWLVSIAAVLVALGLVLFFLLRSGGKKEPVVPDNPPVVDPTPAPDPTPTPTPVSPDPDEEPTPVEPEPTPEDNPVIRTFTRVIRRLNMTAVMGIVGGTLTAATGGTLLTLWQIGRAHV